MRSPNRLISVAALSLLVSSHALGLGVVGSAKVIQVRVDLDGRGMVVFDQPIGGTPPGCAHPAYTNAFGFPGNAGGRAIMAWALAAKLSGSRVSVYGMGVCSIYGPSNVEDWNYGVME